MVSRIFFPRVGRYDLMTGKDIYLIHHVVSKTPLNLPFLIIDAMREVLNRSKAPLPYGMALTMIFRESRVSFKGEVVYRLSYTDTYNNHSLRRMGFVRVDGRWTKGRVVAVEEEIDEEEEQAEGEGPSSPVPRPSSVLHHVLEPETGPSIRVPPLSHTVPTFSLGDFDMGQLAKRVAGILSIQ